MPSVILVIDDDHESRRAVVRHLRLIKYGVLEAAKSEEALLALERHEVDLIILEVALGAKTAALPIDGDEVPPGSSGYDLLEIIRAGPRYIPVIVLTVMDRAIDELACIRAGADVFLIKPLELKILTAYVKSNLARESSHRHEVYDESLASIQSQSPSSKQSALLHAGDLMIDTKNRLVRVENGPYHHLSDKEVRILCLLVSAPGKVFTKQELVKKVWGEEARPAKEALEATVKRIRRKIEPAPRKARYIVSARGMGYRFSANPRRVETNSNN